MIVIFFSTQTLLKCGQKLLCHELSINKIVFVFVDIRIGIVHTKLGIFFLIHWERVGYF